MTFLIGQPHFFLSSIDLLDLIISLIIDKAILMVKKIAISLIKYFL